MTHKHPLAVLLLALAFPAWPMSAQAPEFAGPYTGQVVRVIDGDTFEARVDIWPGHSVIVSVRVRDVDAPELFRPGCEEERLQARLALAQMEDLLPEGQIVTLSNVGPDSFFGRIVADVDRRADERDFSLTVLMERRGMVVPYERDSDQNPWCLQQ